MIESGGIELIHVERVRAPAAKDVTAKKKLSENTPYAKDRERRLQRVLERLKKKPRKLRGADLTRVQAGGSAPLGPLGAV
jgi:hypothetical protein